MKWRSIACPTACVWIVFRRTLRSHIVSSGDRIGDAGKWLFWFSLPFFLKLRASFGNAGPIFATKNTSFSVSKGNIKQKLYNPNPSPSMKSIKLFNLKANPIRNRCISFFPQEQFNKNGFHFFIDRISSKKRTVLFGKRKMCFWYP